MAGALVTVASVEQEQLVTCSRGVRLMADAMIADVAEQAFDLIALPVPTLLGEPARHPATAAAALHDTDGGPHRVHALLGSLRRYQGYNIYVLQLSEYYLKACRATRVLSTET